jgi:hypothetical protein
MNETITSPAAGLSESGNAAMSCGEPGAALRVAAEILGASGFGTRRADGEASRTLIVTGLRDTACEVTDDDGLFRWEYHPGTGADPDQMAGRVMRLLTGTSPAAPGARLARPAPRTGLKGLVGRRLREQGLAVSLEVYEDHVTLDVAAEVSVTNPGRPERGRVLISDEGWLLLECGYEAGAGTAAVIAAVLGDDIALGCVQRAEPALAGGAAGTR